MTPLEEAILSLEIIRLNSLARMEILDRWHDQKAATIALSVDAKEAFRLLKSWEDLVTFCVNHVSDMAADLEKNFTSCKMVARRFTALRVTSN